MPGFTDALVSRVAEAELVPQFASALVSRVKDSGLVGHAVDAALGRVGQQLGSMLWIRPGARGPKAKEERRAVGLRPRRVGLRRIRLMTGF